MLSQIIVPTRVYIANVEYEKLFEGVLLLECRPETLEKSSFVKRIAEVVITFDNFNELEAVDDSYGQFYVRIRDSSDCHSTPDERLLGLSITGCLM